MAMWLQQDSVKAKAVNRQEGDSETESCSSNANVHVY